VEFFDYIASLNPEIFSSICWDLLASAVLWQEAHHLVILLAAAIMLRR
jgi:hypothetical protein